jgi:type I restriction enzyme, R subunit
VVQVLAYLRAILDSTNDFGGFEKAHTRITDLLDESIVTANEPNNQYQIKAKKVIDLATLRLDDVKQAFRESPYKNIEVAELRAFIEHKLAQMLQQNTTRGNFAERLQDIINRYNAGVSNTEDTFEELLEFTEQLRLEEKRHLREGLTEDELELFDLLQKPHLTETEKQSVKLAAKHLLKRLREEKPTVLVQDWHKDAQTRLQVENAIGAVLDQHLPSSYDRVVFGEKVKGITQHLYAFGNRLAVAS